jgi:hypothetical protein
MTDQDIDLALAVLSILLASVYLAVIIVAVFVL